MTCDSSAACCACEAPSYGTVATPPKGGRRSVHYAKLATPTPSYPALYVRTLHIRGGAERQDTIHDLDGCNRHSCSKPLLLLYRCMCISEYSKQDVCIYDYILCVTVNMPCSDLCRGQ